MAFVCFSLVTVEGSLCDIVLSLPHFAIPRATDNLLMAQNKKLFGSFVIKNTGKRLESAPVVIVMRIWM